MIQIIANGVEYKDFIEASVTTSLESVANDFTFSASAVGDFPPLREGDAVQIKVNSILVLTGFIESINGQVQEGTHIVTYAGRDRTGDFIDSQLSVLDDIKASNALTLKVIIEKVLAHIGSDLKVVDALNPAPFNEAEDIIDPEVGSGALNFIAKYVKKRQAILSSTAEGDLLVTQSSPSDSSEVVQSLNPGNDNNVIQETWAINSNALFNRYIHQAQLNPRALNFAGDSVSQNVEDQKGASSNTTVRTGRQKVTVEPDSYSAEQLQNRALWTNQLSRAQATRYGCTVKGHETPTGGIWVVNTLVQINSAAADVNRKMLLSSATFTQGEGKPTLTALQFVEKDVYTINQQLLSQKPVGSLNDAFKALG